MGLRPWTFVAAILFVCAATTSVAIASLARSGGRTLLASESAAAYGGIANRCCDNSACAPIFLCAQANKAKNCNNGNQYEEQAVPNVPTQDCNDSVQNAVCSHTLYNPPNQGVNIQNGFIQCMLVYDCVWNFATSTCDVNAGPGPIGYG